MQATELSQSASEHRERRWNSLLEKIQRERPEVLVWLLDGDTELMLHDLYVFGALTLVEVMDEVLRGYVSHTQRMAYGWQS